MEPVKIEELKDQTEQKHFNCGRERFRGTFRGEEKSVYRLKTEKLEKRLVRLCAQAITDFNLIEDGDKVMVCVSGGRTAMHCLMRSCVCRDVPRSASSCWHFV